MARDEKFSPPIVPPSSESFPSPPSTAWSMGSNSVDASDDVLKLTINTLLGGAFLLEVDPETSIRQLKDILCHMQGIPVRQQTLVYNKNVLADNVTLVQEGIMDGATLQLVLSVNAALTNMVASAEVPSEIDDDANEWMDLDCMEVVDVIGLSDYDQDRLISMLLRSDPRTEDAENDLESVSEDLTTFAENEVVLCRDRSKMSLFHLGTSPAVSALSRDGAVEQHDPFDASEPHLSRSRPIRSARGFDQETDDNSLQQRLKRLQENTRHRIRMTELQMRMQERKDKKNKRRLTSVNKRAEQSTSNERTPCRNDTLWGTHTPNGNNSLPVLRKSQSRPAARSPMFPTQHTTPQAAPPFLPPQMLHPPIGIESYVCITENDNDNACMHDHAVSTEISEVWTREDHGGGGPSLYCGSEAVARKSPLLRQKSPLVRRRSHHYPTPRTSPRGKAPRPPLLPRSNGQVMLPPLESTSGDGAAGSADELESPVQLCRYRGGRIGRTHTPRTPGRNDTTNPPRSPCGATRRALVRDIPRTPQTTQVPGSTAKSALPAIVPARNVQDIPGSNMHDASGAPHYTERYQAHAPAVFQRRTMTDGGASRGVEAGQEVSSGRPSRKNRCGQCSRRLKITSTYACRCAGVFCSGCRHAEAHSCSFDYKTEGRRLLASAAPLIKPTKLPKI
eukprot:m.534689 g.534689  ORF g.534689 m.534689 type:complete len:676 (+) comp22058_c0_seq5:284-2311(+)